MGNDSSIEWTDSTWNPVTGCDKVSTGCENCYAARLALRLQAMGNKSYYNGFDVTLHERLLQQPVKWRRPRTIFVNSMSDLFHKNVPLDFIRQVFKVMNQTDRHQFQVLTKRSRRLAQISSKLPWTDNVWMGVSVENSDFTSRIDHLRESGAAVKFLSLEPLLAPIPDLDLTGIDWVILGGESGPGSRPMRPEWVADVRDQCQNAGIPFFFKQWGGANKKKAGNELDGRTWEEMPRTGPNQASLF